MKEPCHAWGDHYPVAILISHSDLEFMYGYSCESPYQLLGFDCFLARQRQSLGGVGFHVRPFPLHQPYRLSKTRETTRLPETPHASRWDRKAASARAWTSDSRAAIAPTALCSCSIRSWVARRVRSATDRDSISSTSRQAATRDRS